MVTVAAFRRGTGLIEAIRFRTIIDAPPNP
jgi:hypothetical protein